MKFWEKVLYAFLVLFGLIFLSIGSIIACIAFALMAITWPLWIIPYVICVKDTNIFGE